MAKMSVYRPWFEQCQVDSRLPVALSGCHNPREVMPVGCRTEVIND